MTERRLPFRERMGIVETPPQLKPSVLSKAARMRLWSVVHGSIVHDYNTDYILFAPWRDIINDWLVIQHSSPVHNIPHKWEWYRSTLFGTFDSEAYDYVLALVEYILRHPLCPAKVKAGLAEALIDTGTAYVVVGGDTLVCIASDTDASTVEKAFADTNGPLLQGVQSHLKQAAEALNRQDYAGCINHSIHSVEAVVRTLLNRKNATLVEGLKAIEGTVGMHGALKEGLIRLYGYTSDEQGIRHSLFTEPGAKVDVHDAMFFLPACSSFVSYLIAKGRAKGLIVEE